MTPPSAPQTPPDPEGNASEIDALVESAAGGDERAWAELDGRYRSRLLGYIRSHGVFGADADDLVQLTLTAVWARIGEYDPTRAGLSTFVYMVAHYQLLDFLRRKRRLAQFEIARSDWEVRFGDANLDDLLPGDGTAAPPHTLTGDLEQAARSGVAARLSRTLVAAFQGAALPHQSITFGFVRLLEWRPEEVLSDLSPESLEALSVRLESALRDGVGLSGGVLEGPMSALRADLARTLRELVTHWRQRDRYEELLDRVTGTTTYDEYLGTKPAADVAHWWESCLRGVLNQMAEAGESS